MKIETRHEWVCDDCGGVKIHSILNNGTTGTTYCGKCDKKVTVHKKITKLVVLDDETKEALSLYYHLKNHTEVKESKEYNGMPVCKICDKSAYQIMCEEFEELLQN